jgi:UDP-MurNAc hydroxylase
MNRNVLTFVNHACFTVHNDSAVLLVDPWLEGSAFNQGWSLLDQSTSNAALVARLNETGLPLYVWYSHEHPDHFSISFVKKLKEAFQGKLCFLFQHTLDKRVVGFLRRNGLDAVECPAGLPVALGRDMRITVFPYSEGDSWCLINCGGRIVLNLNDCALTTAEHCRAVRQKIQRIAPRVDFLFTQFGYANWIGNPDQLELRKIAASEKIDRIALQIAYLKPRVVVPFASFVSFSNPDNAYLNNGQNTPRAIADAPLLARSTSGVRFLRPGSTIDLDHDSAASLAAASEQAVAHWMALCAGKPRLLPAQDAVPLAEVKAAFQKYCAGAVAGLHGLPRMLEATRRIRPLVIRLSDLKQTVRVSYRTGFEVLGPAKPFHISMTSSNAVFLFKNEYGFDTTHVNGRFQTAHPEALLLFSRFFLPQRMAKNGYDKRHPLVTLRYLMRNIFARSGRQLQAALRRLRRMSSAA